MTEETLPPGVEPWEVCHSPQKSTVTHYWIPVGPDHSREMRCKWCDVPMSTAMSREDQ